DLPSDPEPDVGTVVVRRVVIVPAAVLGIALDREDLRVRPRDLIPGGLGSRRDREDRSDPAGIPSCPLERPVPANGSADHRVPAKNPEPSSKFGLRGDLTARGEEGETRPPRRTSGGGGRGSGRSLAPAENVRGDHEVPIGIDRLPRTHEVTPPARAQ